MKILFIIFSAFILFNCTQNEQKESVNKDSLSKPLMVDTLPITDSTVFLNYSIDIDTAYFYARPDSNTKMSTYITNKTHAVICKKVREFGYAVQLTDSSVLPLGWLKLKYLTQIFFTPPKILKE